MIGDPVTNDLKALTMLLHFDWIRGRDSTGLATVSKKDGAVSVVKQVGGPQYLFDSNNCFDHNSVWCGDASKVFIGHNRAATKGRVNEKNAHPFQQGDIVGAHNGTIRNVSRLEDGHKFEVDSEAIFYNLDKYQVEDVISSLDGAYALTWYDSADDTFKVIRNKERPLWWCRRIDGDVIYWASEKWMLHASIERLGIKISEPVMFDVDTLYSFDAKDLSRMEMRKKDWVKKEKVFGYIPPVKAIYKKGGEANKSNPFPPSHQTIMGRGSTSYNPSSKELIKLRALENQTIEFRMGDRKYGQGNVPYISAYPVDFKEDYDIRIFSHNNPKHDSWLDKKHGPIFTGKVKRFVQNYVRGKREYYLLIDLRTIKEKEIPKQIPYNLIHEVNRPSDEVYYMGYNGQFLNKEEITACSKKGCAGCGDPIVLDEMYLFVEHTEFLCNSCHTSGRYDEFFHGINEQRQIQQTGIPF